MEEEEGWVDAPVKVEEEEEEEHVPARVVEEEEVEGQRIQREESQHLPMNRHSHL